MSVKLPILRLVLSHCIVLVIFFQLGVFVAYDHVSLCDCDESALASSSSQHHHDVAATWWTNNRSTDGRLPPPFSMTRVAAGAMRSVLFGALGEEDGRSRNVKEEALIVRLSHHNESNQPSTTSIPNNLAPEDGLKGCPSVKVFHRDFVENTCLLVASYEESYHVYRWQLDSADGIYRPITRIQNRRDPFGGSPMESFVWAKLFVTIQNKASNDLQQLLDPTEQSAQTTVLLLVVDKDNIKQVPSFLSSMCPNAENSLKVLIWCMDSEAHQIAQKLSFPSYYLADWSRTSQERLPAFSFLVAKILAVQQLVLLKCNVLVMDVASDAQKWLPIPRTMDWRATKADIRFVVSPSQDAGSASILQSPIHLVKSTAGTKALWSKLALSLDLLAEEGIASLDEIVSEYVSFFGMSVATTEMREFMLTARHNKEMTCP